MSPHNPVMRQPAFRGFTLTEFAITIAALIVTSFAVQPILAQARTDSRKPMAFRQEASFQMYAADFDGGFSDFLGKPVLIDNLSDSLARYGERPAVCSAKRGHMPLTGCMPITRFQSSSDVVPSGSVMSWNGKVASPNSGCSVKAYSVDDPVLAVPGSGTVPVDSAGNFWLVSGAFGQGVGTLLVQTSTGAIAEDSVLVLR